MFNISRQIRSQSRVYGGHFDTLAKYLIDYIETGDESLLNASDDISFNGLHILCARNSFDFLEYSWSEKESRLLKLALHRANRNFEKYQKLSFHWDEYGSTVIGAAAYIMYHREMLFNEHLFEAFFDDLKSVGFSNDKILEWLIPGSNFEWKGWLQSDFETNHTWKTGFERYVWKLSDDTLFPILTANGENLPLIMALSKHRPETIRQWLVYLKLRLTSMGIGSYGNILCDLLRGSEEFDAEIVEIMTLEGDSMHLKRLHELRPDSYSEQKIAIARKFPRYSLDWLAVNQADIAIDYLASIIEDGTFRSSCPHLRPVLIVAATNLQGRGRSIFEGLLKLPPPYDFYTILDCLAKHAPECESAYVQNYVDRVVALVPPDEIRQVWMGLYESPHYLAHYIEDLKAALKSEKLVSTASSVLRKLLGEEYEVYCSELLTSSDKTEQSLGLSFLKEARSIKAHQTLLEVLATTHDRKLADLIRRTLRKLGIPFPGEQRSEALSNSLAIPELANWYKFQKKPRITWLDISSLPKLRNKTGGELDETAAWFILQGDHRYFLEQYCPKLTMDGLEPLVRELDNQSLADFSIHILKAWLASDQKTKDGRWAMFMAGILGDDRMIDELVPRINEWCGGSQRQLRIIAVYAISHLSGNTPLIALTDLANRYEGKSKSMSEACIKAISLVATHRRILSS